MSSQANNCRTRRRDRVRFDPRTPGHDHGTGHGGGSSYSSCRSYDCQAYGGGTILVLPRISICFLLCQPCHVGPCPLFVWSLSSTQTRNKQQRHALTSIPRVKAPRPGTIGRGAGRMRGLRSQFRLYLRQEITRTPPHTIR